MGQTEQTTSQTLRKEIMPSLLEMMPTVRSEAEVGEEPTVKSNESEAAKTPEKGKSESSTEEAISTVDCGGEEIPSEGEPTREEALETNADVPSVDVTETAKDETVELDSVNTSPEINISPNEPTEEATETATDTLVSDAGNKEQKPEEVPEEPTAKQENSMEVSAPETQNREDPVDETANAPEKAGVMPSVEEENVSAEPGLPDLCKMT